MIRQAAVVNRTTSASLIIRAGIKKCFARIVRSLGGLLFILLSLPGFSLAESESCAYCKPKVWVGFKGYICSTTQFRVTIDGVLQQQGFGTCNGDYDPINESTVGLTLDQTYQLQVTGACSLHLNFFEVPDDYKLEIDGVETQTIDKVGNQFNQGDGIWKITVRRKCDCGNDEAGESAGPKQGSVMWDVGLGNLSDGRSAGSISLHSAVLDSNIYTPFDLIYSPPGFTNEVDVVLNPDTSLRQVKVPQALADVVVIDSNQYELRFYRQVDVGAKDQNGIYAVFNQPFVTWRIRNPHAGFTDQLEISKIQNGITDTSLYVWNSANDNWTLTTGNGARTETKTKVIDPVTGDWTETFTVTNGTGQTVSKVARTYHQFPWHEELIREIVDPDSTALTSTYVYYENSNEVWRYRRLQSVSKPNGSWEKYDYDGYGNQILILRPWKDQPLAGASEANSYSIRKTFSNFDGIVISFHVRLVSSVVEKVGGTIIRKTTFSRTGTIINGEPAVVESETLYASASLSQTTVTTRYYSTASTFLANRIASIQYPDGRKDTYNYAKGNYVTNADPSLNQFIPDANGLAEKETIVHGTVSSPSGVAFNSTEAVVVSDQFGHRVLQESYVYTGSGYARATWSVMDYDSRGHLIQTRHNNGTVLTAVWNGDLKISETDENGIETTYTYDALNRIVTRTKKGAPAGGGFPAQADIVTTYTTDAEGRTTQETTAAGEINLIRMTSFDGAGRLKTETSPAGLTTTHIYTNGGRTETVVLPGGTTRISDMYLDGQVKSVLGSAVVTTFFDYGVNADGTPFNLEFVGSAGINSPRWTKTSRDWLGRTIKVEKPSFTAGSNVLRLSTYNALGQLQSESVILGANKLQADMIYEYDALGNKIRAGSDIDSSGTLTLTSTDRITETDQVYQQNGNDWFKVITNKTYLIDGNSTPTTVSSQSERLNNFTVNGSEKTISDVVATDVAGNQTRNTIIVDQAGKKLTQVSDVPNSTADAVSITYNGLLQSTTPAMAVSSSTFTYDALARPISVSDPASGSWTQVYNSTTGQLASESHGTQTTSYDYYAASDPNAGRLKSKTDPAGKKAYFNYNSRGEMVQTWGDTVYPIEFVYDAYSQKTEMHTFRSGIGWQGNSWPTATVGPMDVTRWTYQDATGLLTTKHDAVNKQVSYTYDLSGRLATRTWARLSGGGSQIVTAYSYDPNSGEMTGVSYSDGTQPVSFTYDRGGRQATIIDAAGTHTLTHNAAGQLLSEQVAGGLLDQITVTVGYDALMRRESQQSTRNTTTLISQNYGYDASSRLETVTSGPQTATYAYYPTSGLLNTTTFTGGTLTARSYDSLGRLGTSATSTAPSGTIASYTYTYNDLDKRTRVTREDNSYWSYGYNDRGELTSGKKYWSDNSPVAGLRLEYNFDSIGNRTSSKAGGNSQGLNLREASYTANALNQYQQRTVPGAIDVLGTANAAATVTVNDQGTYRRGDYFYKELGVDNTSAPVYQQVKALGVRSGVGGAGEDAVAQIDGNVYVPQSPEVYSNDEDGNLKSDGRWTYTWDAENRLRSMEALTAVPVAARLRLEFAYDAMGRRIQKKVYGWDVGTGSYQLETTVKFVYDGWNVIAELDASMNLTRSYGWGLGGMQIMADAGGSYFASSDGNQNVIALIRATTGLAVALYDYDPFGQTLKAVGEYATQNPFQFSTQYTDKETGLLYYGYRFYNPQTGRWISRDPIGETGGMNLYAFAGNDAVGRVDLLGLSDYSSIGSDELSYSCNCGWIDWNHATPNPSDRFSTYQLWQSIHYETGLRSRVAPGHLVKYGQSYFIPVAKTQAYVSGLYMVKYNLTWDQKVLVALNIVKEVSERFETVQTLGGGNSSFSEEDLVSDLIALNMAIGGLDERQITNICWALGIPESQKIYKDNYGEGGSLNKSKSWIPNYYDSKECNFCERAPKRWPYDKLYQMQNLTKGELWRDWNPIYDNRAALPIPGGP